MTLPDERFRAIQHAKKLLEELCDPGKTPRVPSIVRQRARGVLRHYPTDYELGVMAKECPDLLDAQNSFSVHNYTLYKGI